MRSITSTTELRRMTVSELRREILVKRIEYARMRLGIEMQKEKNHALFKTKRKEIARMNTVMTEKNPRNPTKPRKNLRSSDSSVSSEKSSQTTKKTV